MPDTALTQSSTTATKAPRLLPYLVWLIAIVATLSWLYLIYYYFFIFNMPTDTPHVQFFHTVNIVRRITYLTMAVSAIHVLIKANATRATLYFLLFFTLYSQQTSVQWLVVGNVLPESGFEFFNVEGIVVIILLIRMLQEFPSHLVADNMKVYTKAPFKYLSKPLAWLLTGYRTWLVLLPLGLLCHFLINGFLYAYFQIVCVCLALLYTRVQIKVSTSAQKNRMYWCMWAIAMYVFVVLYYLLMYVFNFNPSMIADIALSLVQYISALLAFVMVVYFSDLLDAGLILRRTLVFGVLFFFFSLVIATLEHYVIHTLAHSLHLNDVFVTSAFAGGLGMLFHPIKEKLEHKLKHLDRKH